MNRWRLGLFALALVIIPQCAMAVASKEGGGHLSTEIWRALNFLALVGILGYLLVQPVRQYFGERRERIFQDMGRALSAQEAALLRWQQAVERLQGIENDLAQLRQEAEQERLRLREAVLGKAERAARGILEAARADVDREVRRVRADLRREVALLAARQAEEMVQRQLGPEDEQRLLAEHLVCLEQLA